MGDCSEMSKIEVTICTGTTCYVMGAANLLLLKEDVSEEFAEKITVKGASCLDLCKGQKYGMAPFVKVGDEIISEATVSKIIGKLRQIMR
jgi:NADH:ubiquinone oxidoreductase subunit E